MMKFYFSPGSCSLAPHIVLEEVGLPFDPCLIDLSKGDQRTPEYLAVNPRGRVPALAVEGTVITEAPALLSFIASCRPELRLIPTAATLEFARCYQLLAFLSSSVHVSYAQFLRPERFLPPGAHDRQSFVEQGRLNTRRLYLDIENQIGPEWLVGSIYTIADAYLFPFYLWGARLGLEMKADFPRWTSWRDRMLERPAVTRALDREGLVAAFRSEG